MDATGPSGRRLGLHRPRAAASAGGRTTASTSADTSVTTRPPSRRTGARVAAAVGLPRERLLFMNQCHGADVATVDGPWGGAAPGRRRHRHDPRPTSPWRVLVADCVPVLLADRRPASSGPSTPAGPGMTAGIVGRAVDARCATSVPTRSSAVVGPVGVRRAATRCRRRCAPTPPRSSPVVRDGVVDRHAGHRRRRRRGRAAARR